VAPCVVSERLQWRSRPAPLVGFKMHADVGEFLHKLLDALAIGQQITRRAFPSLERGALGGRLDALMGCLLRAFLRG
jgi:hypothetical protein